ncbi:MAG: phosphatase PAP2 family protein [Planctomycetaceae bacterium]
MSQLVSRAISWLGGHDLVVLAGFLIVIGGSWMFIELTDEVREGTTQKFDETILRTLRHPDNPSRTIGPRWLAEMARDITALGGYAFLGLLVAAVAGFLWLDGKHAAMWYLLGAVVSGFLVMVALKTIINRPRPDVVPHLSAAISTSFPSGHSMMSAVVFLTLGGLLEQLAESRPLKFYFLSVALFLSLIVGASRVYMGVHYPTDVLAGWTGGLVWSTICVLLMRLLQRRAKIEKGL